VQHNEKKTDTFHVAVKPRRISNTRYLWLVANPEIMQEGLVGVGGAAEDNAPAPSSFIANAHNELYAFYTGKGHKILTPHRPARRILHCLGLSSL